MSASLRKRVVSACAAASLLVAAACEEQNHAASELMIPMSQGGSLAADIHLPPGAGPWPTILVQTAYGKGLYDGDRLPLDGDPNYAFVIVDSRGRGGSSEASNPEADEGIDGYDLVEWVADQPWSNGRVAGWGASALGIAQFRTAQHAPPHLDAIVPIVAGTYDHYERYYPGGVLRREYVDGLASLFFANAIFALAYPSEKPPVAGTYWENREIDTDFAGSLDLPVLLIGGWNDHGTPRVIKAFQDLPSPHKRLIMGPWSHKTTDEVEIGELSYPAAEHYATHATRFFLDKHVRGVGPGLEGGPVWWHDMGTDTWHSAGAWPPPARSATTTYYLEEGGALQTSQPSAEGGSTTYTYDPDDPSPTVGGVEQAPLNGDDDYGPKDQAPLVESRDDALIFSTGVLANPVRLAGGAKVRLYVSSDRTDTDFMVRVTDVYPDGRSMLVVDGARKMRFRNTYDVDDDLITPGEVYGIDIDLSDVGITFEAGHRIRIVVTSSNYPRFEVNPNDGGPLNPDDPTPLVARNTIYHSAAYPSHIVLPTL